ncbi:MAG: tRNA lysidine(34) synthetase TilS [Sedimentisphaerales bacterium]|nr:tRNA lysidine(34) synthetase TilS [Sedimentisphaerales bacterium]
MDAFERQVADFISRNALFAGTRRVLLAISGGADSIALLHTLLSLRAAGCVDAEFVCAHVNHQLRGRAAEEDEAFVLREAARCGLPAAAARVDVRRCAERDQLSLETTARRLRLQRLGAMARCHECACIATGHQKNDNAETVVHRLQRGTGFRGLAGIWPARRFDNGLTFARPLLCVRRDEIVTYLNARKLQWRHDHTNTDPAYTRNRIRHRLLPALQRQAGGPVIDALSDLALAAGKLFGDIERQAARAQRQLATRAAGRSALDPGGLLRLPVPVAVELVRRELVSLGCHERDLSRKHYASILGLARAPAGGKKATLPEGFVAQRQRDRIILTSPRPDAGNGETARAFAPVWLQIPGTTRCPRGTVEARIRGRNEIGASEIAGDKGPLREYLDYDRVAQRVVVRARRPGDRFRPLGTTGEKKLGKFLTAARVPQAVRNDLLVFDDGEKIIWACPVRISERVKVTADTRRVIELKVTESRQRKPDR